MAHKPISMRCTREQFEEIKPILEANGCKIDVIGFEEERVLVNNYCGDIISDLSSDCKHAHGRQYHDTWNELIFLDACGITTEKERGITITHIKDVYEPETKYDVTSRVLEHVKRWNNSQITPTSLGELIAAEIEAYAEMKVQQSKELEKQQMISLVQSLKDYTRESNTILGHDEREASEFVDMFYNTKFKGGKHE